MKKIIFPGFLLLVAIAVAANLPFIHGQTMKQEDVCKKWGEKELNIEIFKRSEESRASMACSLMKNQKQFIGKDTLEIRNMLGNFTGHYFSEMYPTYLVQIAQQRNEESWQLLFLIDRSQKVTEVVMHKNCCER